MYPFRWHGACRIEKIYQDIKMVAKHGGFRKGAGRPKGSRNRATIAREARQREALAVARAEDASLMPIDFLLRVLRDPTTPLGRRIAVAKLGHSSACRPNRKNISRYQDGCETRGF